MDDDPYMLKLDAIHAQVQRTNGRVTVLESDVGDVKDVLYGDPQRATIGLVTRSQEWDDMVRLLRAGLKVGKWVAGGLVGATGALIANLIDSGIF